MSLILPRRKLIRSQPTWRQLPRQRQRFFQGQCPCCESCDPCVHCDPAPAQWEMEAVGLADGFCTDCESVFGGVQTLTNDCLLFEGGNPCTWSSPSSPSSCVPGCGDCIHWQLNVGGVDVDLLCDGGGMATYYLAKSSWDCNGPNVMDRTSATIHCNTWPATITLSPV